MKASLSSSSCVDVDVSDDIEVVESALTAGLAGGRWGDDGLTTTRASITFAFSVGEEH